MVGFSDRAADPSGRRAGTQSRCRAARAGARQRHLHRAPVSSDHAGQHRRIGGSGPPPAISDPRHSRRPHRERGPAADRAERRPSRRAGAASAGVRAGSVRHLQDVLWPQAGRPVYVSGFAGCDSSRRPRAAAGSARPLDQDRQGLQLRIPQHLARRFGALGRRPRPRGAQAGRQHQVAGRGVVRHHRAQDLRNRARESAGATGLRAHRAGGIDRDAGAARRGTHRGADEGSRRPRKGAGAIAPGAEDGNHRPAHRRRRA